MLKPSALAIALALTPALAAHAQPPPAGVYTIDPRHAQVLFGIVHLGFSTFYGTFSGVTGTLRLDPAHPAASQLDVTVPAASLTTINDTLNGELRGADWLDAAAFPTITFHSTRITMTGPTSADVTGDLTLHGVTRPETLHATLTTPGVNPMDKAYTIGFDVGGRIRRSDFGVVKYPKALGDEVRLIISAPFEWKPS